MHYTKGNSDMKKAKLLVDATARIVRKVIVIARKKKAQKTKIKKKKTNKQIHN